MWENVKPHEAVCLGAQPAEDLQKERGVRSETPHVEENVTAIEAGCLVNDAIRRRPQETRRGSASPCDEDAGLRHGAADDGGVSPTASGPTRRGHGQGGGQPPGVRALVEPLPERGPDRATRWGQMARSRGGARGANWRPS